MKKTISYNSYNFLVVEWMCADAVAYSQTMQWKFDFAELKRVFQEELDVVTCMLAEGAPSVDIIVERDGSVVLHRNDVTPKYNSNDVVFRYEVRLNTHKLFDVVRYDYRDEAEVQKDVKKEEYSVEYKGTTYVFDNVYERDLVESMSQLIKHNGDEGVSGTEFGNMIKYVFRLLDVKSDWKL